MRISINVHSVIHRPPHEVFAWLTTLEKWDQWGGNVLSMEQISDGPLQVGSRIRQVTKGGRKTSGSILEVTHYVSDQSFGIKSLQLEGTFTLEPLEADTRLNARFDVEATGLMALLYKLMLKRFVMNDLRQFKKLVESSGVGAV
jgi:hypothetical protein